MSELKDKIITEMNLKKSMTFVELCDYGKSLGYSEWDVATILPAMCKEGYLQKISKKIKKRKLFGATEEITETRYYLR